jgi:hypothetical protein
MRPHVVRSLRWSCFVATRVLLSGGIVAAGAPSARAQIVSPKTVPVRNGQQFEIFPSDRAGMAGVSIAVDDTLLDPFVSPARAARVGTGWVQVAPFTHSISGSRGGGRTLPLSVYGSSGRWSMAGLFSLQELDRANVAFNAPISDQRATNQYLAGAVARRIGDGLVLGAGVYLSTLGAVDGVDLLYAGSDRIAQSGGQVDVRLGLARDWASGRTLDLLVLANRYRMTHDVHYPQLWRWNPCCGTSTQTPARDEHNADRTNTVGVHAELSQPIGTDGWRVGWLLTANRHSHPKIPNYQIQNIPRDPGHTNAFNAGIGLARTRGGTTLGMDLVLEPIWSRTWADAARDTTALSGATIRAGQHTVDNAFRFSNTHLRVGLSHDAPASPDSGTTLGFQAGLAVYSINYELNQQNRVQGTSRQQRERWMEWTPTLGLRLRTRDMEVSYAFSHTCGPTCSDEPMIFAVEDVQAPGGGPIIAAPSSPLDFNGGTATRHRVMVAFRLK